MICAISDFRIINAHIHPQATRFAKAMEEIMKLRISEIKKELDLLKVSHKGFFEKKEFAEVLAKARMSSGKKRAVMICVCSGCKKGAYIDTTDCLLQWCANSNDPIIVCVLLHIRLSSYCSKSE